MDEKKLTDQIQALKKEKNDAHAKISELQKRVSCKMKVIKYPRVTANTIRVTKIHIFFCFKTEQLKENEKQSKETVSCTVKKMQDLEVSTKKEILF